jgi:hypothetical protein
MKAGNPAGIGNGFESRANVDAGAQTISRAKGERRS